MSAEPPRPPLDDLMMAMDVVDTLRHDEAIAIKELAGEERDKALIERLREIYVSQGIEVPDRILREGVEGLKENRFLYTPPAAGFSRSLALVYVRRHVWGKWAAVTFAGLVAAFIAWQVLVVAPAERRAEELRIELSETLPADLQAARERIDALAVDEKVRLDALIIAEDGARAAAAGDAATARKALADLKALEAELAAVFEVRIVSRPDTPTGLTRIPDANPDTENFYLVVEAVAPDGSVLPRQITSEEDGRASMVSIWGQRVAPQTFERVRQDKQDDGIVQDKVLGRKERGRLTPDWAMPVQDGAITKW
ncbi:hypothetical protein H2509_11310 [Stappia sp. F7233]|uniref:Uncharacterized protein n=1 Tax=Stappia albiluteola TaxID=2758565 RepID=A0A839AFQ1_9HYPH|nr:DUF6384 family protein [Stappia albiluteola]MBA5777712.1 hypothetical protein [Stappia albiluteola]